MKKIIPYLFVLLLLLSTISALEIREEDEVYITTEINENLYVAGGKISIDAPVNGDITAFGGDITVNSPIEEDIMVFGGNVNLNSPIKGSAHACGGDISINAVIDGDLMSGGGNININNNVSGDIRVMGGNINIAGNVGGDILALGGNININGDVAGDVAITGGALKIGNVAGDIEFKGGEITINGIIEGNVKAEADKITLRENALIKGDLAVTTESKLLGKREQIQGSISKIEAKKRISPFINKINFKIFGALALLLIGIILVLIIPTTSNRLADNIKQKFWISLLYGLLALIVTPIAAVLIMITVIGIPVGIILFILYVLAVFFATFFAALYLGKLMLPKKKNIILPMIVGLIVLMILANIPWIGWIIKLIAILLGLGAITLVIFTKKKPGKKP